LKICCEAVFQQQNKDGSSGKQETKLRT
jgi:hypothetical protein